MDEYSYKKINKINSELKLLKEHILDNEISYKKYINKIKEYNDEINKVIIYDENCKIDIPIRKILENQISNRNKYYSHHKKCKSNKNKIKRRKARKYH